MENKNWAVPKEPSTDSKVRRLAIQVEDHDLEYGGFEGRIPEGEYGAGSVEIWDSGEYELIEKEEGFLRVRLHGKRLNGVWKLVHTNYPPGNQWLLIASRSKETVRSPGWKCHINRKEIGGEMFSSTTRRMRELE